MTTSTRPRTTPVRRGVRASVGTTEMWLLDEIGDYGVSARQFVSDLKVAGTGPVQLHISSPGGDAFDGLAIYEALRSHPGTVTAYVDGLAASIASVIMCAADEVVIAPSGMVMIHDALSMTFGNEADHLQAAALLGKVSDTLADIYAARAGGWASAWRATMRAETWYSASEAVAAGLADRVAAAPVLSDPVARLQHATAARAVFAQTGGPNVGLVIREGFRQAYGSAHGVVAARAGGPARPKPLFRRQVPNAMATIRALKAVR